MNDVDRSAEASRYIISRYRAALIVFTLATAACGGVTAPSLPPLWHRVLPMWSPYIVIGSDNSALAGYRDALTSLANRSAILGARIGLAIDGSAAPTVNLAASFGLDVIGIMDNADLIGPDVEGAFDRYRAIYPQIRTLQIGNEVTTSGVMPITIDQYIAIFTRIYDHAVASGAGVTLVSQATFGSGTVGASDLAAEANAFQAHGMSGSTVVLGVNAYSQKAIDAYTAIVPSIPSGYRIWVTETGIADPTTQTAFVAATYPVLRAQLRAERIYWYVLWAGDSGGDSAYSLISGAAHPPIVPGPLFQILSAVDPL